MGALLLTMVLGTVPGGAAVPLGEGGEDPPAQQAVGARGAGAVRRDGRLAEPTARSTWATTQALYRDLQRAGAFLIRNARIFAGDGKVIENGAVLVRDGKIAAVYEGAGPDPDSSKRRPWRARARRCCPG